MAPLTPISHRSERCRGKAFQQRLSSGVISKMLNRPTFPSLFVERLRRSVKYEDIYLRNYETVHALHHGLETYFRFYHSKRPHQSLGYLTPAEVHYAHQESIPRYGHPPYFSDIVVLTMGPTFGFFKHFLLYHTILK
jgi:hypothetical protein